MLDSPANAVDGDRLGPSSRQRVIAALRIGGPLARVELAAATALSPATVTAATAELLAEGFIEEVDAEAPDDTAARRSRGRPKIALRLRTDAAYVAGVKISMHQTSVSITNFVGDVLSNRTISAGASAARPETIADLVADAVTASADALNLPSDAILGVGVGMPGFIDVDGAVSHWSPLFSDGGVVFGPLVAERLGRPVFVDNDSNLAALSQLWFGHGRGVSNFLVVTVEHGVGIGIVIDGRIHRGARGFGAEFGHMKIQRSGALCRCGQRGCIEAYIADYAILREASTFTALGDPSDPVAAHRALGRLIAAAAQDARIQAIYARAGEILGVGVANAINLLGPDMVVVTGTGVAAAPYFEPQMRAAIAANVLRGAADHIPVIMAASSEAASARGAAALVLERHGAPAAAS